MECADSGPTVVRQLNTQASPGEVMGFFEIRAPPNEQAVEIAFFHVPMSNIDFTDAARRERSIYGLVPDSFVALQYAQYPFFQRIRGGSESAQIRGRRLEGLVVNAIGWLLRVL